MDRRTPYRSTSESLSAVVKANPTSQRRETWYSLPRTVGAGPPGPITASSPRAGSAAIDAAANSKKIRLGWSTPGCSLGRGGRCPPPAPSATSVQSPTSEVCSIRDGLGAPTRRGGDLLPRRFERAAIDHFAAPRFRSAPEAGEGDRRPARRIRVLRAHRRERLPLSVLQRPARGPART